MKIYLAAGFSRKEEMAKYADILKNDGYEIVSSWVYGGEDGLTMDQIAAKDLEEVAECDVLAKWTLPYGTQYSGGGRQTEFGAALAMKKIVFIVGPREQIFDWHPHVIDFPYFELLRKRLAWMSGMSKATKNK